LGKSAWITVRSARGDAEAEFFGRGGEGEEAVGVGDAEVRVVGAKDVAVHIEVIAEFGEVRGGADEDAGFNHAADHGLEAGFARGLKGFEAATDAGSLDEFHVDAMKAFGGFGDVLGEVIGFVAEDGQGRALLEPGPIFDGRGGRHGLLDVLDVFVGGEAFNVFEGFFFGFPAFVGIDANGFFRRNFAEGCEVVPVVGHADFDFEDGKAVGLLNFFAEDVGFINADGAGGDVVIVAKAETEEIVDGLFGFLAGAVEESDVDGAFSGHVAVGNRVEVGHAAFDIAEGKRARIDFFAERFDGINRLFVTRDRCSLAETDRAVRADEFDDDYGGNIGAFGTGDGPFVGELQFESFDVQFHGKTKAEMGELRNEVVLRWFILVAQSNCCKWKERRGADTAPYLGKWKLVLAIALKRSSRCKEAQICVGIE